MHTPGPWISDYVEVIGKSRQHEVSSKSASRFVAGCGGATVEDEANARLIAAAPELLEACNEALNTLLACCVPAGGCDDPGAIIHAQGLLRSAIAKAEGKS